MWQHKRETAVAAWPVKARHPSAEFNFHTSHVARCWHTQQRRDRLPLQHSARLKTRKISICPRQLSSNAELGQEFRLISQPCWGNRHPTERWPSGRRRSPAKGVYPEGYRGFESLPLRHFNLRLPPTNPRRDGFGFGVRPLSSAIASFRLLFWGNARSLRLLAIGFRRSEDNRSLPLAREQTKRREVSLPDRTLR
jgi:hypothetical protein